MIVYTYKPVKYKVTEKFNLTKNQQLLLLPIGDVHEGTTKWPREKFLTHLKWGVDRGATFLGMGEYFDFTSTSQRLIIKLLRDSTKQHLDEMMNERIMNFVDMIKFTKGHWMGMLEGGHYWVFENGISSDQLLCQALGCPFLGTDTLIRIVFNVPKHTEADCIVFAHHGVGGGRTPGGHLTRMEDLLKWVEADIYLMGHVHTKVNNPIDRQYVSPDGVHYHRTKLTARTGGWLLSYPSETLRSLTKPAIDSRGTYVEQKAMMPTSLGGLAIGIGYDPIEGSQYYRPTIHYSV